MYSFKNLQIKDKILIGIIFLVLIIVVVQKLFLNNSVTVENDNSAEIKIGDSEITVKIAKTVDEKYKGLSDRKKLAENEGMLFLHQRMDSHEYVMRNMNFDLDFIFIRNKDIVDIAKNVSKDYKGVIKGATMYNKVLEVPAGWTSKNNIKLGGEIMIN